MTKKLARTNKTGTVSKRGGRQAGHGSKVSKSTKVSPKRGSPKRGSPPRGSKTIVVASKSKKSKTTKKTLVRQKRDSSSNKMGWTDLKYHKGFGNHIESEAIEGSLPQGQNNP